MNHLKISTRLHLAFAVVIAAILVLAAVAGWRIRLVSEATERMQLQGELLRLAGHWQGNVRQNSTRTLAAAYAEGTALLDFFKDDIAASGRDTTKVQDAFTAKATDAATRRRLEHIAAIRKSYVAARDAVTQVKASDSTAARALVREKLVPATDAYSAAMQELVDALVADSAAAKREVESLFQGLYVIGGSLLAAVIVLAALLSWRISGSIARGLDTARQAARRIGEGNLTQALPTQGADELAQMFAALAEMQARLTGLVETVRQNADAVAAASTQISQGNNELSSRTEEQAAALQQTAASMKQLAVTVRQNADSARQGNALAQAASDVATRGGAVVGQVVATMKGINDSSRKIADILGVIDGIAFQTNILALNAAVEAARAGEQGRGFAVVAGEVRTLAQRSAEAAKEIKTLITASVERVEQGSALVDQAGSTMNEVVDTIRRVTDLMGEISAASTDQSVGVGQIGEAVQQMDQATQQNAALVEESAAAAAALQSQAHDLVGTVAVFKLREGDKAFALAAPPAAPAANSVTVHRPAFQRPVRAALPARTGTDGDWQTF
jgi:methyl-accepting chemotaxis protein